MKYALQYGYAMTPIYTFGETDTFSTFTGLRSFRLWLNTFGIPAVAFWGSTFAPLFPRLDAECLSYVGPPLQCPLIENPTKEQVDEWHAKYLAALKGLFDDNKAEAGCAGAQLEIW